MQSSSPTSSAPPLLLACLIALGFFVTIAPTLTWIPITGGMETNVVIAGMEAERDGNWLVPTQNGEPRTRKPPLAHWTTGLGLELLPTSMEFAARAPSLLFACAMLVAVYALGRTVAGAQTGLLASLICGSTLLFLQFSRQASYDVQLAFWVVLANACLARAVLDGLWVRGLVGAGLALGLAMLAKGPVALAQTIAPALVFVLLPRRWRDAGGPPLIAPGKGVVTGVVAGTLVMLAVALPWPVMMLFHNSGLVNEWSGQVTLRTETSLGETSHVLSYLIFLPLLMPWTVWFGVGVVQAHLRNGPDANRKLLLVWLCVIVPIVIMNFVPVRRPRYLLPMLGPAAVLAAAGVMLHLRSFGATHFSHRFMTRLHWILVGGIALGLAVAGTIGVKGVQQVDGRPWFTVGQAVPYVLFIAGILALGIYFTPRFRPAFVVAPAVCMVALQAFFMIGYRNSPSGVCEEKRLVERVLVKFPTATLYNGRPDSRDAPLALSIYGNRVLNRLPDLNRLQANSDPQIVFRPEDPKYDPIPASFTPIDRERFGPIWWSAYLAPVSTGPAKVSSAP